jgi:hypothetical protein
MYCSAFSLFLLCPLYSVDLFELQWEFSLIQN